MSEIIETVVTAESDDLAGVEELAAVLSQRSATYSLLSRLYLEEMDQALLDELHVRLYPKSTGDADMDRGYFYLATFLSNLWTDSLAELKIDFSRSFLGGGLDAFSAAYPYESVYTSEKRLMMQAARDEVLAIYRANGIEKGPRWREGEDHIALELEFERILCDRTVDHLLRGNEERALELLVVQRDFLKDHLGAWAPMMTADLKVHAETKLYQGLAYLTEGFLRTDRIFLEELLDGDAKDEALEVE